MSLDEWYASFGINSFGCPRSEITADHQFWRQFENPQNAFEDFFDLITYYLGEKEIKHLPVTDYEKMAFAICHKRRKLDDVHFSVTGQTITSFARQLWQEKNFKRAMDLLGCAEGITFVQRVAVIEGRMRLEGVNTVELVPDDWTPPEMYAPVGKESLTDLVGMIRADIENRLVVEGSRDWSESMYILRQACPVFKKKKRSIS
jgi:hypothetical protein